MNAPQPRLVPGDADAGGAVDASEAGSRMDGANSIEACVIRNVSRYLAELDGGQPMPLHALVMRAVEKPLLQFALAHCEGNRTAAAALLGITRNTLHKKLQEYGAD